MILTIITTLLMMFAPSPVFGAAPSVLKVQQGGTGAATFTPGECLIGNGTGPIQTATCGSGGFSTTSANFWSSVGLGFSTTSSDYWLTTKSIGSASTTLLSDINTWTGSNSFSNATSSNLGITSSLMFGADWINDLTGDGIQVLSNALSVNCSDLVGTGISCVSNNITATLGTSISVGEMAATDFGDWTCNGSTCTLDDWASFNSRLSTTTVLLIDPGQFFSTTSANYWSSLGLGFSTTSADAWGTSKGYITGIAWGAITGTLSNQSDLSAALYGRLSTSSTLAAGANVLYATGPNTVASVATSTPTVTAPITYSGTLGNFVGGAAGSFGCTTASGSATGCLSSTDWTTFNNKAPTASPTFTGVLTFASMTGTQATSSYLSVTSYASTSALTISNIRSAVPVGSAAGVLSAATAQTCTNQFFRSLSAAYSVTCATVAPADVNLTTSWDFGGATGFEIPNGSAPTVDAIGEIALDTTSNQLLVATSTNATYPAVFNAEREKTLILATSTTFDFTSSTSTFNYSAPTYAELVRTVSCYTDSGTTTIRIGDGTNWMSYMQCGSGSNTIVKSTGGTNNSFTALEKHQIEISNLSGTPKQTTVVITSRVTRD